jgi:hypothetical protein
MPENNEKLNETAAKVFTDACLMAIIAGEAGRAVSGLTQRFSDRCKTKDFNDLVRAEDRRDIEHVQRILRDLLERVDSLCVHVQTLTPPAPPAFIAREGQA